MFRAIVLYRRVISQWRRRIQFNSCLVSRVSRGHFNSKTHHQTWKQIRFSTRKVVIDHLLASLMWSSRNNKTERKTSHAAQPLPRSNDQFNVDFVPVTFAVVSFVPGNGYIWFRFKSHSYRSVSHILVQVHQVPVIDGYGQSGSHIAMATSICIQNVYNMWFASLAKPLFTILSFYLLLSFH